MQFLVLGFDGNDSEASERRAAAREAHLELGNELRDAGTMLYAVAMLDEKDEMAGSAVVYNVESREALDAILEKEPYVNGEVWQRVEVVPCRVPPSFENMKPSA